MAQKRKSKLSQIYLLQIIMNHSSMLSHVNVFLRSIKSKKKKILVSNLFAIHSASPLKLYLQKSFAPSVVLWDLQMNG